MKKMLIGLSLVALLALGAGSVFARGLGLGPADCPYNGQGRGSGAELSENQRQFMEQSMKLRQELAADKIELRTQLSRENPDEARILKLRDSITAKQERIADLAREHDVQLGPGKNRGQRGGKGKWQMQQGRGLQNNQSTN
jgi:hypothetical protein